MRKLINGFTGELMHICEECGRDLCDAQDWAEAEVVEDEACCDLCGTVEASLDWNVATEAEASPTA